MVPILDNKKPNLFLKNVTSLIKASIYFDELSVKKWWDSKCSFHELILFDQTLSTKHFSISLESTLSSNKFEKHANNLIFLRDMGLYNFMAKLLEPLNYHLYCLP